MGRTHRLSTYESRFESVSRDIVEMSNPVDNPIYRFFEDNGDFVCLIEYSDGRKSEVYNLGPDYETAMIQFRAMHESGSSSIQ